MSSPEETRLKKLFANLREEDGSVAPPFDRMAAGAAVSSRRDSSWRIALAAMAVLVIVVMFALRPHPSPYRSTDATPRELAAWSSPTAFLLATPGKQFLNQMPRLGEPLMESLPAAQDGPK